MKKNIKKGFTLAELLISIAIISIISTMGIVISKKGMDKAYDYYVYNSYKSISSAIGDAISNNCNFSNCDYKDKEYVYDDWVSFMWYIQDLFGNNMLQSVPESEYLSLYLKNGIVYIFNENKKGHIRILIPSANSKGRILDFYLDPEHYEYGLIPASNEAYNNSLSVLNRIDLLPFTIDDGETGKIASHFNTYTSNFDAPAYLDPYHKAIERYSYKDAFCKLQAGGYGNKTITDWNGGEIEFEITCPPGVTQNKGVLRLLNPKKVF